ncbi:MAG: glycosyltransferase family 4 protein [Elusimicrobiales bacterium]|nr:glycosyltransferase family 4 protein [Elusimicrobiales bacterium]
MNKIKVIHIITKLELGGAQQNTLYTVTNLSKEKFDVKLISGIGGMLDKEAVTLIEQNIIFIKDLIREISPISDFRALISLFKILRKEKPQIIHTHSSKAGILARIAGFLAGIKIIIHTYHGFGFHDYQNSFLRKFYIFLEKITSLFSDALIFVSKANMETAKKYSIGKKDKYYLIRSGIKLSDFSVEKNREFAKTIFPDLNDNSKIIITVSNLKPQKNPMDFFKIAEEVLKEFTNVYFIYIGGGTQETEKYYKQIIIDKKIDKRCVITGWLRNTNITYSSADIFILTSLWEGLPRSLVEAMASGLIPVCYNTDGVRDLIKNNINGFIIEKFNWMELANVIKKLISDSNLYQKIKSNLIQTDLSEFDIDFMVKQQEKLYFDLIKYKEI